MSAARTLIMAAYFGTIGYQVHKKGIDVKVLQKLNDGFDALARRNAQIWSEELTATELGAGRRIPLGKELAATELDEINGRP